MPHRCYLASFPFRFSKAIRQLVMVDLGRVGKSQYHKYQVEREEGEGLAWWLLCLSSIFCDSHSMYILCCTLLHKGPPSEL